MSDANCGIASFLRDRHWKMVPDKLHEGNIGIHATLLNEADHFRRLHYNPLLANNMYGRCYVVHGQHPATIRGWRPPRLIDYAHSVGGVGWMAENFSRAVTLHLVLPEDRTFYTYLAGYCWNVASTLMFHLYTLEQNAVTGRMEALQYFLGRSELIAEDRSAAELLVEHKENPSIDSTLARELINAAGRILTTTRSVLWRMLPPSLQDLSPPGLSIVFQRSSLYPEWSADVPAFLGDPPETVDVTRKEDPEDYVGTMQEAIASLGSEAEGFLSPKENFEFLRDLRREPERRTKIRVWDRASYLRRMLSHDFDCVRGLPSAAGIFFGWEDGVQALIQRLHEVFIEKGAVDDEVQYLSLLCNAVVAARLSTYSRGNWQIRLTTDLWETTSQLSRALAPLMPIGSSC